MTTYIMLSAGSNAKPTVLLQKEGYLDALETNSFLLDGSRHVFEEFEACCWCDAMIHYNKVRGVEPYDQWDCNNQFNDGIIPCEYYFEIKAKQNENR